MIALAAGLAMPRWVRGQATQRFHRLGWLSATELQHREPYGLAFVQRLRELGFVNGANLTIEYRHAAGTFEKLPSAAAELARLNVDILFSAGPEASLAALQQIGADKPIVFVAVDFDPIATGHLVNPARPGGRLTGVTAVQSLLPGKRLELVKELLPATRKVAVLGNDQTTGQLAVAEEAAKRLALELHVIHFKRPPFDYESAVAEAVRAKSEVLFVLGSALFTLPTRRLIPELALKARLPSVFHHAQWAEAGGLMSYGFNFPHLWRSAADMVGKILRGAKAGEIPMEQPTTYELAINARTAKALGIRIPESIRVRVDRVIDH
ncbi:MAG TPA: ABC transporter substrate-binding protein [Burkholderiales bacterium]|nr:ABC transporter substrate-binding protein [Burkholderiales bacterium]